MLIMTGTPFTATEAALERWLSSRLLSGGIQRVDDIDKKKGSREPNGFDVVMNWKRQTMFSLEARMPIVPRWMMRQNFKTIFWMTCYMAKGMLTT